MAGSTADFNDQIALRTPSGRVLAGWASALICGVAISGVAGGLMDFDPATLNPIMPLTVGAIAAYIYAKTARLALLPAIAMCAVALIYVGYILLVPPATWGVRYPIAHYISGAVCALFALQGLRAALAERRAGLAARAA